MRVKKARKERKQEGKPPLETARFHEILQEEFIDNQVPELLGKAFKVLMEALQKASKETEKNSFFLKYLGDVLEITELDESSFCAWGGSNAWAYIFNQTGQALERSILDFEREILLKQCETFAKLSRPPVFQEIFVLAGLLDYLKTHTIDPCNLFISNFPSDVMLKFQFIHPQKEKGSSEEEEDEEAKEQKKRKEKKKQRRKTTEFKIFKIQKKDQEDNNTPLEEKNQEETHPTRAFERKPRLLSNNSFSSVTSPPASSPRKQRLLSGSFYPSPPPSPSPPPPLRLTPQLISSFKGDDFDSLQTLVARWDNVKDCPNFAEIEISVLKKLLNVLNPHSPGDLVAVEIEEIPEPQRQLYTNDKWEQKTFWKSVYCRIKRCLPSSHQVEVWITPEEDTYVVVPESAIISFDWEQIHENEILPQCGAGTVTSTCVGNPLLFLQNELHNLMEEEAKKLLKEHEISYSDGKARITNYLTVWDNHVKLQNFLQKGEGFSKEREGGRATLQRLEDEVEGWLKNLPLFSYKHFYCKKTFLREVKRITASLQFNFQAIFQREYDNSSGILAALRTKLFAISDGKRKNAVCGWWLAKIEEESHQFLISQEGFAKDSLPTDYTDRPPEDLQVVTSNLNIIQELLGSKELKEFVNDLIRTVYTVLDTFLAELEFYLDSQTPTLEPFVDDEEIEAIFKPEIIEAVKKDYEYMKKMQEMDMEILSKEEEECDEGEGKKGLEMTDVVPVGGLIMARFHMEEVEHSTAMDVWGGGEDLEEARATTPLDLTQVNSIKVAKRIHLDRHSSHTSRRAPLSPHNLPLIDPLNDLPPLFNPLSDPLDPFAFPIPSPPPLSPPDTPSFPPSPPSSNLDLSDESPTQNPYNYVSPFLLHPSYSYASLPPPSCPTPSPPSFPSPPKKIKKKRQIPSTFLEFLGFDFPPPSSDLPPSYRFSSLSPPSSPSSPSSLSSPSSSSSPFTTVFPSPSPPPTFSSSLPASSPPSTSPCPLSLKLRTSTLPSSPTRPRSSSPLSPNSHARLIRNPSPPVIVGSPRSRPVSPSSPLSRNISPLSFTSSPSMTRMSTSISATLIAAPTATSIPETPFFSSSCNSCSSCSPPPLAEKPTLSSSCSSPPPESGGKKLWRAGQSFSSYTKYNKEGTRKIVRSNTNH